jgi:hypothetical protein
MFQNIYFLPCMSYALCPSALLCSCAKHNSIMHDRALPVGEGGRSEKVTEYWYDVGSSHPGAVVGPKGWAVRPLKWYVSWVQNVNYLLRGFFERKIKNNWLISAKPKVSNYGNAEGKILHISTTFLRITLRDLFLSLHCANPPKGG